MNIDKFGRSLQGAGTPVRIISQHILAKNKDGDYDFGNRKLCNVAEPMLENDCANKVYVDKLIPREDAIHKLISDLLEKSHLAHIKETEQKIDICKNILSSEIKKIEAALDLKIANENEKVKQLDASVGGAITKLKNNLKTREAGLQVFNAKVETILTNLRENLDKNLHDQHERCASLAEKINNIGEKTNSIEAYVSSDKFRESVSASRKKIEKLEATVESHKRILSKVDRLTIELDKVKRSISALEAKKT